MFDTDTKDLTIEFITFNMVDKHFTTVTLSYHFLASGKLALHWDIGTFSVELYGGEHNVLRLVFEIILVVCIAAGLLSELMQLVSDARRHRSLKPYLSSFWNWIDWTSLGLFLTGIALWVELMKACESFNPHVHYSVYDIWGHDTTHYGNLHARILKVRMEAFRPQHFFDALRFSTACIIFRFFFLFFFLIFFLFFYSFLFCYAV